MIVEAKRRRKKKKKFIEERLDVGCCIEVFDKCIGLAESCRARPSRGGQVHGLNEFKVNLPFLSSSPRALTGRYAATRERATS